MSPVPNTPELEAVINGMATKIERMTNVAEEAAVLIETSDATWQQLLDEAEAKGASIEELSGLQAFADLLAAKADRLSAAMAARIPGQPTP